MTGYRTNLQICDAIAAVLNAEDQIPILARDAAAQLDLTEAILRERLVAHRVPKHQIELFITRYQGAKETK